MQENAENRIGIYFSDMSWYLASCDSKVRDEFPEQDVEHIQWLFCALILMIGWQIVMFHTLFHKVMIN